MADHKLILHPQNPNIGITDFNRFISELRSVGLIKGDSKTLNEAYFEPGSRFLELISFLQNRHALRLHKGDVREIVDNCTQCSVQLIDYGREIKFHGINTYTDYYNPCCPSCRSETEKAADVLSAWYDDQDTYQWLCKQCGRSWKVYDLDWQQGMAFTRCAIDIWNIHPDEAIPSQELLEFLREKTGGVWKYFYYRF